MKVLRSALVFGCAMAILLPAPVARGQVAISSPGGDISATVSVANGRLTYNLQRGGFAVVEDSPLGITVNSVDLGSGVSLGAPVVSEINETYDWYGAHSTAVDHCLLYTIPVTHTASGKSYTLEVRAYDDGLAYRYVVPGFGTRVVGPEASSWTLPAGSTAFYQPAKAYDSFDHDNYETLTTSSPIENIVTDSGRVYAPFTVKLPDGQGYASILEGGLYDYSGMHLLPVGGGTLQAIFTDGQSASRGYDGTKWDDPPYSNPDRTWTVQGTVESPWRITVATSDLTALVNSDIVNNVNPPADAGIDWSFVEPGRAVWSWWAHGSLFDADRSEDREMGYIDEASALGFEYTLLDDGWKWWSADRLDRVLDHADEKDIGVWVWKHSIDVMDASARRSFFDWCVSKGVVGVKIDFLSSESADTIAFYEDALTDAARRGLMINFHGATKATGESRTFPNEMTREGIWGLEHRDVPTSHYLTLPFTRFLGGNADFTPFDTTPDTQSWAFQMASAIVFTSTVQHWADDPALWPAKDVIAAIPAVWDQTVVLEGSEIGQRVAFARRSGDRWLVGVMNGDDTTPYDMPLSFVPGGAPYRAVMLADDMSDNRAFDRTDDAIVWADELLDVRMRAEGGFVALLRPIMLGDADLSDTVDLSDLGILATYYGTSGGVTWRQGDFNRDGRADLSDLGILASHYGESAAAVPEPASALILAMGAAVTARRLFWRRSRC